MNEENLLDEVSFIGGSSQTLGFTILDRIGSLVNLNGATIKWTLTRMGQKNTPLITKDNKTLGGVEIVGEGEFTVILNPNDTKDLTSSRYEQEPIIILTNGKVLRPTYGFIDIRKGSSYE